VKRALLISRKAITRAVSFSFAPTVKLLFSFRCDRGFMPLADFLTFSILRFTFPQVIPSSNGYTLRLG
jgi:hypothetical protein